MGITFGLPNDNALLAAVANVAIRHGQLDYILRMTIKSIAGLSIKQGLDATERQNSSDLRQRIRKLAKQKFGEGQPLLLLEALLTRSRRASERRNELLHGLWAVDADGNGVFRHDDHNFRQLPAIQELEELANELIGVATELNNARLEGFLKTALESRSGVAETR